MKKVSISPTIKEKVGNTYLPVEILRHLSLREGSYLRIVKSTGGRARIIPRGDIMEDSFTVGQFSAIKLPENIVDYLNLDLLSTFLYEISEKGDIYISAPEELNGYLPMKMFDGTKVFVPWEITSALDMYPGVRLEFLIARDEVRMRKYKADRIVKGAIAETEAKPNVGNERSYVVTIPPEIVHAINLGPHDRIWFKEKDGHVVLERYTMDSLQNNLVTV